MLEAVCCIIGPIQILRIVDQQTSIADGNKKLILVVFRPPGMVVPGKPYVLLQFFFNV